MIPLQERGAEAQDTVSTPGSQDPWLFARAIARHPRIRRHDGEFGHRVNIGEAPADNLVSRSFRRGKRRESNPRPPSSVESLRYIISR
jgi:hypothetical protein